MRRRRTNDKYKIYIIASLFLVSILMAVGYAAFSKELNINAVSKIFNDWELKFSSVAINHEESTLKEDDAGGAIVWEEPVIDPSPRFENGIGIVMHVNAALGYFNDKVVYDVEITNYSEMFSAEYVDIDIEYLASDPFVSWIISGISEGDIIEKNTTIPITLTAYWNPAKIGEVPADATKDLDTTHTEGAIITLNFQASNEAGSITPEQNSPIPTIEYSTEDWTNGSVVATITFDQENVTITNNGGNNTYIFDQNGSFTFNYKYDIIKTGTAIVTVNWIDKTGPVITSAGNSSDNVWTNGNVTIAPSVTETDSGFYKYLWNVDGGEWNDNFPGIFTNEINSTIGIIAVDKAGNQSSAVYTSLKIDKTAPIIVLNGSSSMTIGLNDPYIDPGAVVNDNFSTGLSAVVTSNVVPSIAGTYSIQYNATDLAGNTAIQVRRTVYVTENFNLQRYSEEMEAIQNLIVGIEENNESRIGTALTETTAVSIRGINYHDRWYLVTAADVLAINPTADVGHAPYIVRYEFTPGAVISIAGEVIEGSPIHTFNYSGDPESYSIYTGGLLTAVTQNSTKSSSAWGEAAVGSGLTQTPPTITPGGGMYDEYGGLILGNKLGFLAIDQDRPVGEKFAINVTVRGAINQSPASSADANYGVTIVAISDANSKYLAWIRLKGGCLQVITYLTTNQATLVGNASGPGYMSKTLPAKYDNDFMNIQVTSQRGGTSKVYINGELFSTFPSGSEVLSYGNMTIGDLRPARGMQYIGSVYNFALYSEAIDQDAITQNWNYIKNDLGL